MSKGGGSAKMKKVCFLLVIVVCFYAVTVQAEVQYLGEMCFTLSGTPAGPQTLRLGILSYGADTFPINGKIQQPIDGGFASIPLHGSGVVNGNTLSMSLDASSVVYGPLTSTYSVIFDLQLLAGTFEAVILNRPSISPPPPGSPVYTSATGTVSLQACQ
jgi:hypothetical protein